MAVSLNIGRLIEKILDDGSVEGDMMMVDGTGRLPMTWGLGGLQSCDRQKSNFVHKGHKESTPSD